jgi:peroxiredoxin Q/BCP
MTKTKKKSLSLSVFLLFGVILLSQGCSSTSETIKPDGLQVGDKVDNFSLVDQKGHAIKLSDVPPGWYVVIYLYRGLYCSGCQNRLFKFKDDISRFNSLHVALMAISTDLIEDSAVFNQQWRFPFPLLSDPHLQLIDTFGARHPHGHGIHDVAHPSYIIIDPQKIIRYKLIALKPDDEPTNDELLLKIQQFEGLKKSTN